MAIWCCQRACIASKHACSSAPICWLSVSLKTYRWMWGAICSSRKPASITSILRSSRSGVSFRMHNSKAVDIDIGAALSAFKASGITKAKGSRTKRQIIKPMVAFQKPITIQGSVTANRIRIAMCAVSGTAGPSARCISQIKRTKVVVAKAANRIRRKLIAKVEGVFTKFPNERLTLTYTVDSCPRSIGHRLAAHR